MKIHTDMLKVTRATKLFQPFNSVPRDTSNCCDKMSLMSKSQKLMIDLGIIRQSSTGLFHLLPLGVKSVDKLKCIVRRYFSEIDAQEIKMPIVVEGSLWKKSGRWDIVGQVFKFKDRHGSDCILSPTSEESVAELVAGLGQLSHKQFPMILYQVGSKFRDEIKPRCGLLRAKEFEMMDAYSFNDNLVNARCTYDTVSKVFENIFTHLSLPVFKVLANPGEMGGELSHEYHLLTDVGEDVICICTACKQGVNIEHSSQISCLSCGSSLKQVVGVEIGHTFLLGNRYSLPLGCKFMNKDGKMNPVTMGSYGLGLTRLLAASLELLSSEDCISWPSVLAPFLVCVIPPKEGSKEWDLGSVISLNLCKKLEKILPDDVLLDDRCDQTIGKRLRLARRTGYPFIVCIGKQVIDTSPKLELISTKDNTVEILTMSELLMYFEKIFHKTNIARRAFL